MKLVIQPIMLDDKKALTGLLYLKSVLETGFGFDKQLTIVNNPITQLPT